MEAYQPESDMEQIEYDGDVWNVLSKGATREGKTFLHLVSTTRYVQQSNGRRPIQICEWVAL